ncbi:uncharacterized protein LOC111248942 [Varroa destructor]|uniref:Uncharacterized protein n=1 Tax=Varroa destructor TaxID=109461 RepID=A0A7M7JVG7_VARDE|nr:uncharacterized protein LOC111248942 [Varroa destructor]
MNSLVRGGSSNEACLFQIMAPAIDPTTLCREGFVPMDKNQRGRNGSFSYIGIDKSGRYGQRYAEDAGQRQAQRGSGRLLEFSILAFIFIVAIRKHLYSISDLSIYPKEKDTWAIAESWYVGLRKS